jgi:hypothetical protein
MGFATRLNFALGFRGVCAARLEVAGSENSKTAKMLSATKQILNVFM